MKTTTKIVIGFVGALFLLCILVPICIIEPSHNIVKDVEPIEVNITMDMDTLELDSFDRLRFDPKIISHSDTSATISACLIITENSKIDKPRLIYSSSLKDYIDIDVQGVAGIDGQECLIAKKEDVYVRYLITNEEAVTFNLEVPRGMLMYVDSDEHTTFRNIHDLDVAFSGSDYLVENCTINSFRSSYPYNSY